MRTNRKTRTLGYKIILQRNGQDIETIGWNGVLKETRELARRLGLLLDADVFWITDLTTGEEVCMEHAPFAESIYR